MSVGSDLGHVLLIGAGGIGAPAAIALLACGVRRLVVCDADQVELSNLHRQILFREEDVGRAKLDAFRDAALAREPSAEVELRRTRFLPETAADLLEGVDVVLDATDNFASRFLVADACHLHRVPVVHAAAVRYTATVMAVSAEGGPCYRCLFEDFPDGDAPDCATAGVLGPVCGVAGAIAADRAVGILRDRPGVFASIVTFDGLGDRLRQVSVRARADCALCGAAPQLLTLDPERYMPPTCDLD